MLSMPSHLDCAGIANPHFVGVPASCFEPSGPPFRTPWFLHRFLKDFGVPWGGSSNSLFSTFFEICIFLAKGTPRSSKWTPKGSHWEPQGCFNGAQREPNGIPKWPHGTQKGATWTPKGASWTPKAARLQKLCQNLSQNGYRNTKNTQ